MHISARWLSLLIFLITLGVWAGIENTNSQEKNRETQAQEQEREVARDREIQREQSTERKQLERRETKYKTESQDEQKESNYEKEQDQEMKDLERKYENLKKDNISTENEVAREQQQKESKQERLDREQARERKNREQEEKAREAIQKEAEQESLEEKKEAEDKDKDALPENAQENETFIPLSNKKSIDELGLNPPELKARVELLEEISVQSAEALTNRFYSGNAPTAKYAIKKYRIYFQTLHDGGRIYPAQADVYIPQTDEAVPVIGSASGTTGIFDHCAPSKENIAIANWGDYHGHHAGLAGQGYAVVFPDYSGFNDTDMLHHYFVADFEARVVLDSLRAIFDQQEALETKLKKEIVLSGYSQGGHAILGAADLWKEYAPDLPLKGIVGFGSANNTIDLLLHNGYLGPYLVYAYNDLYGDEVVFPPALLQGWVADSLESDLQLCIGKILNLYGRDIDQVYQPHLVKALRNETMPVDYPAFTEKLIHNTSGYGDWNLPVLVAQGVNDPITPISTQKKMMERFCLTDKPVTYLELASADHYDIRQKTLPQVLQWIKAVINDEDIPNYCNELSL